MGFSPRLVPNDIGDCWRLRRLRQKATQISTNYSTGDNAGTLQRFSSCG
jgi:hypothetical protein